MREGPKLAGGKAAERAAREVELAAALRDNLRRRKEQQRAQAARRAAAEDASAGLSEAELSGKSRSRGNDIAD